MDSSRIHGRRPDSASLEFQVITDCLNILQQLIEITRNGDLLHRRTLLSAGDPETFAGDQDPFL